MQRNTFHAMAVGAAKALLAMASISPAAAMASDAQHWEIVTLTGNLGDGWRASAENITRFSQTRGFYELEQNLMLGHEIGDKGGPLGMVFYLGYTHDPQYAHGNFTIMEHRFRQQLSFDRLLTLGPVRFSGRIRVEQRWREGLAGTGWRLRPSIKAAMPVVGKVMLVAAHESFIDANSNGFQRLGGEERMRNSLGFNMPLNRRVNLELGYLNQHGFVPGGKDTNDNAATLELKASF